MQFDVFDADHPGWKQALGKILPEDSDINFLPEWYQSWQEHEQAVPKCIVATTGEYLFIYPFFMKPVEGYDAPETWYDIQTAYGYGGVITNRLTIPRDIQDRFNQSVNSWLLDNHVVAEFIREHPLLNHCRRDADYSVVRQNVYVDLKPDFRIPDAKARQNISKTLRNEDISILVDEKLEFLDEFVSLYHANANRLKMSPYYFFPKTYFDLVKTLLKNNTRLIHILYKEKIISSNLFFHFGNKGTMHLAGSDFEFQALRVNDLLYYGAMQESKRLGLDILNIGGGTTNQPDDSLFRFKCKFSNNHKEIFIGRKIINRNIYDDLIHKWEMQYPQLVEKYRGFFLRYRQTS